MSAYSNKSMLKIDGSTGEGGGQIIRTALSLSMLTGTPIEMVNIRAGRAKPGLMRQHLMCVQASEQISDAAVTGAKLHSTAFRFVPKQIKFADYSFDIGSAGSTSLVLQTILPALLFASHDSIHQDNTLATITIKGGTHNPLAPTTDFLNRAFIPAINKLGMQMTIDLVQAGFAPVGGGEIKVGIKPYLRRATQAEFDLVERGELLAIELVASNLNLEADICKRELACATSVLIEAGIDANIISTHLRKLSGIGEGNTCFAVVTHRVAEPTSASNEANKSERSHQEVFTLLGEKRTSAEKMGNRLAGLVKRYLFKTDALVDEYLTDQLLLPLALSGGGEFSARTISQHTQTQAWLIEQFLPVEIKFEPLSEHSTLVRVVC